MASATEIIARRLLKQAKWCAKLRSPLYAKLLYEAATDVRGLGVCWTVLRDHHDDPPGSALALRFLGAVHRLVLEGKAPQLAACYPSMGCDSNCDDLWPRFHAAVHQHATALRDLVDFPVQTNEVGRCAALLGGFLDVVWRTGLPLRLLEVGAAADFCVTAVTADLASEKEALRLGRLRWDQLPGLLAALWRSK